MPLFLLFLLLAPLSTSAKDLGGLSANPYPAELDGQSVRGVESLCVERDQ